MAVLMRLWTKNRQNRDILSQKAVLHPKEGRNPFAYRDGEDDSQCNAQPSIIPKRKMNNRWTNTSIQKMSQIQADERGMKSRRLGKDTFDYAADLGIDTETIQYDLDGQAGYEFTRVLDRHDRSVGRDTGWVLNDTTDPQNPVTENTVTYGYNSTTGLFETVVNAADTFTYGYAYNQGSANDPRVGSTTGTKRDLMPYTLTKSGSPVLQTLRTYEAKRDVLAAIQNQAGGTTRSSYTYIVNEIGQRTDLTTAFDLGSGVTANPGDTDWGYDSLGQVTSAAALGIRDPSGQSQTANVMVREKHFKRCLPV